MRTHAPVLLLLLTGCGTASTDSPLDTLVPRILQEDRIPGAVIVAGDIDAIRYRKAFGTAKPDTIFDLASCTKAVATATAALLLVEQGRLSLDQRLGSLVKCFGGREITIRDLLLHRSRLPAYLTPAGTSPEAILSEFAALPPLKADFTYS